MRKETWKSALLATVAKLKMINSDFSKVNFLKNDDFPMQYDYCSFMKEYDKS